MVDDPKPLTLERALRADFASRFFEEFSASQRQKAVTRAVARLDPLTRAAAEALVEARHADTVTAENARERLAALILTGTVFDATPARATTPALEAALRYLDAMRESNPGAIVSAIRWAAGVATDAAQDSVTALMTGLEKTVDAIEPATTTGAAPQPPAGTPKTVTATARPTSSGEEETMTDEEFQETLEKLSELIDKLDGLTAFDESKLPERLRYTTQNGQRAFSEGQRAFITGTLAAMIKLGAAQAADEKTLVRLISVLGLLLLDGRHDPDEQGFYGFVMEAVNELNSSASATHGIPDNARFEPRFALRRHVFAKALAVVLKDDGGEGGVFLDAFAAVGREMVDAYDTIKPEDRGFAGAVRARYANQSLSLGGGAGGGSGVAYLDLPPLSEPGDGSNEIVPTNIEAIASIYVVYQCEQMMLFSVTDRIVELFMAGLLPMQGDTTARHLDNYYWNRDEKVSPTGRAAQYTRALGAPGGNVGADVQPNTEFNSLLLRVISSISEYERQNAVGNLLDSSGRRAMPTTGEYVRKAVRDLAANCTLYGFAGVQFAAERMGRQLKSAMQILQLPRVREIYGVTNMWQVIERVAQSEFGTTVNVVKHRTMAEEVRKLLGVVADNPGAWSATTGKPLFASVSDVYGRGYDTIPGDLDANETSTLFRAAQYFLAVNGVQADQVYEYSQPVDTPALPSIPGMGTWGGMQAPVQPQQPQQPAAPNPIGGLQDMVSRGRAPTGADIRGALPGFN
jgi:hypothetical protein